MIKEQAIEVLRCNTDLGYGVIIENESTQSIYEALDTAIKALDQQPSDDKVSLEVYKQVTSERDIAIEQLRELGYSFGEKIRTSEDCVSSKGEK